MLAFRRDTNALYQSWGRSECRVVNYLDGADVLQRMMATISFVAPDKRQSRFTSDRESR